MESFFDGKRPTTRNCLILGNFTIFILFGTSHCAFMASNPSKVGSCHLVVDVVESSHHDIIGCMPCSKKYLTEYYLEKHKSLCGLEFHSFGSHEFWFDNSCGGLIYNTTYVLGILHMHRQLVGEGSHRRLISTMRFSSQLDIMSWFDGHICELMIMERLPFGVFADPFELEHLVQRQFYLDAAVFGDTNLELPSALSNRSIVEIHMDIRNFIAKSSNLTIELPLHARYPPLDASGYSRVEIGEPDLLMRCRPKSSQHGDSKWALTTLNAGSVNRVAWLIPCGSEGHTAIVSVVTFISALVSALVIVYSAVYCSMDDDGDDKFKNS